ncbi:MAG: glycerol kinase GlpK [Propionibacteriaceae bacterium]|nr:glycerol kinase GlpK [Propionibacteriaceae bacterium]
MSRYVIGLDQSTSGTTVVLVDRDGRVLATAFEPVARHTPRDGWVEQDADELWTATRRALHSVVLDLRLAPDDVEAIGIANQRETTVMWERHTGRPVGRAIGWQDRRTRDFCTGMPQSKRLELADRTGMNVVPNAAGTKLQWLLTHDRQVQSGVASGRLLFGTVDSWLVWNLSGGSAHITDHSNASVTLLQDARSLAWSPEALDLLRIPRAVLPDLRSSCEVYALTSPEQFLGACVPISACLGDQQAALLGQGCISPGMAKNTYGAGSFMVLNTGRRYLPPDHGTFSPVVWSMDSTVNYGIEAMRDESGAVLRWLRDGLGVIGDLREVEGLARQVPDAGGLHFVPHSPLGGVDSDARTGGLLGLGDRSTKAHVARAALESIAFQTRDAFEMINHTSGKAPEVLRVDGGGARNDFLMQFQADILGIPVERPYVTATTPLGAAYAAGLAVGYWDSIEETASMWRLEHRFEPQLADWRRDQLYADWLDAVSSISGFLDPSNSGQESQL